MQQSPHPVVVAQYARRLSVEELDDAIAQVADAYLTSSVTSVSVLGLQTGQDPAQTELLLRTLEAARSSLLESADADVASVAIDAVKPFSHGLDFSRRPIE